MASWSTTGACTVLHRHVSDDFYAHCAEEPCTVSSARSGGESLPSPCCRYVLDEVAGNNHAYLVDNLIRASAEVEALLAPVQTSGRVTS